MEYCAHTGRRPAPAGAGCEEPRFMERWTDGLNRALREDERRVGWYDRLRCVDFLVADDIIRSDPQGPEYPAALETFRTRPTAIPSDVLYGCDEERMEAVLERHCRSIGERKFASALYALAPDVDSPQTPVLCTTGEERYGRLRLCGDDLGRLAAAFDRLGAAEDDRILVLCPQHADDLASRQIGSGRVVRAYGFDVYVSEGCPSYELVSGLKAPWVTVPDTYGSPASVAFAPSRCLRAEGSLRMYWNRADCERDVELSNLGFRKRSGCVPGRGAVMGAIYGTLL